MTLTILQTHSVQIGEVVVNFTIGRIGKTDAANASPASDRELHQQRQVGVESSSSDASMSHSTAPALEQGLSGSGKGLIAPSIDHVDTEVQILGGAANSKSAAVLSSGTNPLPVAGSDAGPATNSSERPYTHVLTDMPATVPDVAGNQFAGRKTVLRPHCLRPDNCGDYGKNHCNTCLKAAAESEVA